MLFKDQLYFVSNPTTEEARRESDESLGVVNPQVCYTPSSLLPQPMLRTYYVTGSVLGSAEGRKVSTVQRSCQVSSRSGTVWHKAEVIMSEGIQE